LSLELVFDDGAGGVYDLTWDGSLYFGKIQLGEVSKAALRITNPDVNRVCSGILIEAVAHPTDQLGTANDTYLVTEFSDSESGSYSTTHSIPSLAGGSSVTIWIRWSVPTDALPGFGRFAIKATGVYEL